MPRCSLSRKDDAVFIRHMIDMARKAVEKTAGLDRAAYDQDENLRLALAHLIQIIGEAARRVSPVFQTAHPQIPWSAIIGMRHKVVHDYFEVDDDIIWAVVTLDLPELLSALEGLI
ncbi:hypothetical protein D3C87_1545230 [compost metagenome]